MVPGLSVDIAIPLPRPPDPKPTLYLGDHAGRQMDQGASKPRFLVAKERTILVAYLTGKSPLNLHIPSSSATSTSDWFTFATVFSRGPCELCSSSPAGSRSSAVLSLPGLEDRVKEGGFWRKQPYSSTPHWLVFSPSLLYWRSP